MVAVDGRTLVFVEVKTRRSRRAGNPVLAVDDPKQRRLARLALDYCQRQGLLDCAVRFDVVGVLWCDHWRRPQIEHFRGAFENLDARTRF